MVATEICGNLICVSDTVKWAKPWVSSILGKRKPFSDYRKKNGFHLKSSTLQSTVPKKNRSKCQACDMSTFVLPEMPVQCRRVATARYLQIILEIDRQRKGSVLCAQCCKGSRCTETHQSCTIAMIVFLHLFFRCLRKWRGGFETGAGLSEVFCGRIGHK